MSSQLARGICRTPAVRDTSLAARAIPFAGAAAFLFACHPLQTQAVTYVIQRSAAMAGTFYVWSLVAYLAARARADAGRSSRVAYGACVLLAVAAVLSKENAVTLPMAVVLTEWAFFGIRGKLRRAAPFAAAASRFHLPIVWKALSSRFMEREFASLPGRRASWNGICPGSAGDSESARSSIFSPR